MNKPLKLYSFALIVYLEDGAKPCGIKFVLDDTFEGALEQIQEMYPEPRFNHFFNEEVSLDVKQVLN